MLVQTRNTGNYSLLVETQSGLAISEDSLDISCKIARILTVKPRNCTPNCPHVETVCLYQIVPAMLTAAIKLNNQL